MEINYYRQDNAQGYEEAWSSCHFTSANDIFSLSTVREVTTVRHISGYDLHVLPNQVKARHSQLKRDTRDAALLDQIHRLHLLDPIPSSNDSKEVNEIKESKAGTSKSSHDVNNSLTFPTHPQSVAACPVGGGSAAVKTPVHVDDDAVIPSGNQPCQAHTNPNND